MWHWFAKGPIDSSKLLFKIIFYSFFTHIFFIVLFFVLSRQDSLKIQLNSNKYSEIPLVFLPLTKTVKGSLANVNGKSNKQTKSTNNFYKVKPKKIFVQSCILRKNLKKNLKAKRLEIKKLKKDKKSHQALTKNEVDIKPEETKLLQPAEVDSPMAIGRDDMQELQLQQKIRESIVSSWKCPPSLSKKLFCKVKMFIDIDGTVRNVEIIQSSKSLVFDMSARKALLMADFPKEIWAREIEIQCGPEEE